MDCSILGSGMIPQTFGSTPLTPGHDECQATRAALHESEQLNTKATANSRMIARSLGGLVDLV